MAPVQAIIVIAFFAGTLSFFGYLIYRALR
jgi:hypothetical protein